MTVNKLLAQIQRFVNFIKPKNNFFKDLEFRSDQPDSSEIKAYVFQKMDDFFV